MHRLMRMAKLNRNLDMYVYFDKAYEGSVEGDVSMYVGVHELCHLTSKVPCGIGQHRECEAMKCMQAYNALKVRVGAAVVSPRARVCVCCVLRAVCCVLCVGDFAVCAGFVCARVLVIAGCPCLRVVQSVTMLGPTQRHIAPNSIVKSKELRHHLVMKVNVNGIKQKRILAVDPDLRCLFNLSVSLELKKKLPLRQLIQVCAWS
jgi:hypothetical protein